MRQRARGWPRQGVYSKTEEKHMPVEGRVQRGEGKRGGEEKDRNMNDRVRVVGDPLIPEQSLSV